MSLAFFLIVPQQSTNHVTPPPSTFLISLNTSDPNVTTKVFSFLSDPLLILPVQDPAPLKWGVVPLFVLTLFTIFVITLRLFLGPPPLSKHLPGPNPSAFNNESPQLLALQVPLLKTLQKLLISTLLFPVLITAFYTTLVYPISPPPSPTKIYQNETQPEDVGEAKQVNLSSLLLPDPEPPKLPSGGCSW